MRQPSAYITRLDLEHIRGFEHLTLDFETSSDSADSAIMASIIIGSNGTGKSTILRCMALAMCPFSDVNTLLSYPNAQMITQGMKRGSIMIGLAIPGSRKRRTVRLELVREDERDTALKSTLGELNVSFFACGYGASRGGAGDTRFHSYRVFDSVMGLFDYEYQLLNPELMLRRLEDFLGHRKYDQALQGIQRVLGLGPTAKIGYARGGGIRISGLGIGKDIPLDGWADGYRLTFKWIMDLYGRAIQADAIDDDGHIRGILLVDEIEQHLHPSMQAELVTNLRNALPRMQVFATTHSPLTALGVEAGNLIALHRDGARVYRAAVPTLVGLSAEDVLTEESLFGTSPYSEATQAKLEQYNQLKIVAPDERTDDEVHQLQMLAADLSTIPHSRIADDPITAKLEELLQLVQKDQDE